MKAVAAGAAAARLDGLLERRTEANRAFFAAESERLARLCHVMAERFARGGRLVAFGSSPAARSDARHVAVEFVHPVIVGKRALPALALAGEGGDLAGQVELLVRPDDIAIAFGIDEAGGDAARALAAARARGCLTIAFAPSEAEWGSTRRPATRLVRQELVETLYHVLWELVHVFFDHRGLLEGRDARRVHDAGASSFLYPFLGEREDDLEAVVDDVRRSALMKAEEIGLLRGADPHRESRRPARGGGGAAGQLRAGRQAARVRQRRVGDGRDGRGRRLPPAPARPGARGRRSTSPRTPRS